MPAGTGENLWKPENREKPAAILKYHVVPGKMRAADIKTMEAKTAQGQSLKLEVSDAGVVGQAFPEPPEVAPNEADKLTGGSLGRRVAEAAAGWKRGAA